MANTRLPCVCIYMLALCVYMYVCISAYLYICISVFLYFCISVYLYICMFVYLYICMFVYLYICISVYLYVSISVCLYICIFVYLYICITVYATANTRLPCARERCHSLQGFDAGKHQYIHTYTCRYIYIFILGVCVFGPLPIHIHADIYTYSY